MTDKVTSADPTQSTPCLMPRPMFSTMRNRPRISVVMPIGTFTKKIQCQLRNWVSTPPANSPMEPPPTATKT